MPAYSARRVWEEAGGQWGPSRQAREVLPRAAYQAGASVVQRVKAHVGSGVARMFLGAQRSAVREGEGRGSVPSAK